MCIPFDWISILDFLGRLDVKAQNSIFPDSIGIKKKHKKFWKIHKYMKINPYFSVQEWANG